MTNYLTINDTAAVLNVSVNTVRSMLPKLGAIDLKGGNGKNRMIRIPEDTVTAYLQGCKIKEPISMKELREMLAAENNKKPIKLERRRA